jgi:hypothetical protein
VRLVTEPEALIIVVVARFLAAPVAILVLSNLLLTACTVSVFLDAGLSFAALRW